MVDIEEVVCHCHSSGCTTREIEKVMQQLEPIRYDYCQLQT